MQKTKKPSRRSSTRSVNSAKTAQHRPATRVRKFRHDDLVAVDLFSGFGGLTQGIERAGFTTIMAANHNEYKVKVHEANHPNAEHWIADLVNPESADYHSARDLPAGDMLVAGVSCVNHSAANTKKAYARGLNLFDLEDPDFEDRVTRSERDRATANCFPAGTVVLARRGMVPIEQLVIGDEVLTHRNRWRPVTGTTSRRAPVHTVKGRGHTALEVTADHRFLTRDAKLTRRGWTFADRETWAPVSNLVGKAWQSPTYFPHIELPAAPDGWKYDAHFWWTVGRWLGDGWIRHCTPSGAMVGICCAHTERNELDGLWNARITKTPTTIAYEIRGSGALARWLIEHFGELAHGKSLPAWALSMPVEYRQALLDGYISADGAHALGGRRASCATVSRALAVGFKLLLQTLGYRPSLRCRPAGDWTIEGRTGTTRPLWILQWMAQIRRASTIASIGERCVGVVREVSLDTRDTEVFDIEVAEDHSFLADGFIVHNCVLHYAAKHHPLLILVECTTQLSSWGPAIPGKPKIGDGSTYRWWLKQFENLGYKHRVLYLNSMFFGVPQSRDRGYWVFWDKKLPTPDLDHRPETHCGHCDKIVQAKWTWKTGIPPTGLVAYGKQYMYCCPSCRKQVNPPFAPSLYALDLSDLGTKIGDRAKPLAPATMARAERCRQRFAEFPAVVMPAKGQHGVERQPWQPLSTQTSQQEAAVLSTGLGAGAVLAAHRHNGDGQHLSRPMDTVTATHEKALLTTGALMQAAGNTFERDGSNCRSRAFDQPLWTQTGTQETGLISPPIAMAVNNFQGSGRGVDEALPTQGGSETLGLLSAQVLCNRENHSGRSSSEPMHTVVANAGSGGLGLLSSGVVPFRNNTVPTSHSEAMPTVTSDQIPGLLTAAGRVQCNGGIDEAGYRAHPVDKPLGTVTSTSINQGLLFSGWYKQNGSNGTETAPHPITDPFGTLTARDTTAILAAEREWHEALSELTIEDCYFRMLTSHETGRGCGFDVDFPGHKGTFVVWGSARDQVDGFGNAVSPAVPEWIGGQLRLILHGAFS